jgi:hypothetical protein
VRSLISYPAEASAFWPENLLLLQVVTYNSNLPKNATNHNFDDLSHSELAFHLEMLKGSAIQNALSEEGMCPELSDVNRRLSHS